MFKLNLVKSLLAIFGLTILVSCGGGGGASSSDVTPPDLTSVEYMAVTGQVVEQDSQEPLQNAKVSVQGTSDEALTDEDGYFNVTTKVVNEILLNTSASNYATSQKIIERSSSSSSEVPFSNIKLKSTKLIDTFLLTSVSSSGKKNLEPVETSLTEIDLDATTELDLIPGNSRTNTSDTLINFLALKEIQLVRNSNNEIISDSVPEFEYSLVFEFEADENEDLAGLLLWRYGVSDGKWELQVDPTLVSASLNGTTASVIFTVKKTGWYALGKKLQNLACVKGRVLNQNGVAVENAKVIIEGQSFNGQISATTNASGIFTAKVKAGAAIKVYAIRGGYKSEPQLLSLQNYTHNEGGAADGTYCQPAGPIAGDPFYLEFSSFSDLVPPTGFLAAENTEALPLTIVMNQHTINGTINYVDGDSSLQVPVLNNFIKIKGLGSFALTSDGNVKITVPVKETLDTFAEMQVTIGDKTYSGQTALNINPSNAETSFTLNLIASSKISISGVVTLNGQAVSSANVTLTSGVGAKSDNNGKYALSVPSNLISTSTSISAKYVSVGTGYEYFSSSTSLTNEATQTIDFVLKSFQASVKGSVCDSLGTSVSGALIKILINGVPTSSQAQTNDAGAYSVLVPLRPNVVNNVTITAIYKKDSISGDVQGFTTLDIDPTGQDESSVAEYSADKIVLDINNAETTAIGKVLINDQLAQGVTVVFNGSKVLTNESGSFKAKVAPGQNVLSLYQGNEPLLLTDKASNLYEFTAQSGIENDLGNLKTSTTRVITFFTKQAFLSSDDPNSTRIKSILTSTTKFAYLHLSAKGTAEAPVISVDSSLVSLVSEVKTQEKLLTEQIYKVNISTAGTLTIKFKASETGGEPVTSSLSLIISNENQAPLITRITKESETINSTNETGFSILVEAVDPEGLALTYSWKLDSPLSDGVTLKNETSSKVSVFTKETKASEIVLVVSVSDGSKSAEKKVVLPITQRSNAISAFKISNGGIANTDTPLTMSFETNDNIVVKSITIDWGDGSATESLKKSKSFSPTHSYTKEGTYTISLTVVDEKDSKTILNQSVKISNTYVAPVLIQGKLTTKEDTAERFDLKGLISNYDANKKYAFSIVKKPTLGLIAVEGFTLLYTPNLNANGTDQIILKVSDGVSFSNEGEIKISIEAVNDAPVMVGSSIETITGITVQVDLKTLVKDPDETDQHTFKVISNPVLGTASIEGNILKYNSNNSGNDKFSVIASDQTVNSNEVVIIVKVNQIDSNLKLADVNLDTLQDKELTVDLSQYLTNPNNLKPVQYVISQKGTLGDSFISGNNLVYSPFKSKTGTDSVFIIAKTDTVSTQPALFTIKIMPVATAPILIDHSTSLKVGDTLVLDLTKLISNFDSQTSYTFQFSDNGKPTKGDVSQEGNTLIYKAFGASSGIDKMSIFAIANGLTSNVSTVSISLEVTIQPPVITSTPEKSVNEGSLYTYKVIASHPSNLPMTYVFAQGPSWLSMNKNQLSGTPGNKDVGIHDITIKVTDGTNTIEQFYQLEVRDVNFAPVITSSSPTVATAGLQYSYLPTATDVDGDNLTWSLKLAPSKMTIDSKTGQILWTPSVNDPTSNTVTLAVSDGVNSVSQKWTIALTITPPAIIGFVASDPDNGDSVFSKGDVITINFDQSTNMPPVSNLTEINTLLKFNQDIGDDYRGKWLTKSLLQISISDAGKANPKIGVLRVAVLVGGQLKNEAGTSNSSTSSSDVISGNWGKGL